MGILESGTQLSTLNPRIEGSKTTHPGTGEHKPAWGQSEQETSQKSTTNDHLREPSTITQSTRREEAYGSLQLVNTQRQPVAIHGDESHRSSHKAVPTRRLKGGPNGAYNLHEHMASTSGSFMTKASQQATFSFFLVVEVQTMPQNSTRGLRGPKNTEVGVTDGGVSHKTRLNHGKSLDTILTEAEDEELSLEDEVLSSEDEEFRG
ncbi:hypothetical protein DPX16_14402 [Anabarilius grahami]|uniref:Uncharacterized protein n=1 Tax=Anabarilius grahami TaxID=495550 RepID=A0A3N0XM26_ANAGA|nr:hypothetical protein DPX16_14402 [Anabarilius grahami]